MSAFRSYPGTFGLLILVVSLAFATWREWRSPIKSSPHGYHSRRASAVLIFTSELVGIAMIVIGDDYEVIGLHSDWQMLAVVTLASVAAWIVYQAARRRWPAGSD